MVKELIRPYKVSDEVMLIEAEVFLLAYTEDEADFVAFNPVVFHAAFKTEFRAEIDAAYAAVKDVEVVGDQKIETAELLRKLRECGNHYLDLKFYVKKAYPSNKEMWEKFGFANYKKAKDNQKSMIVFMEVIAIAANKFKTKLIAAGYTQVQIDKIQTLANELKQEEIQQEDAKSDRPLRTRQRIITLSKPWGRMVDINRASKSIYRDNYEKLNQYELPPDETQPGSTVKIKMKSDMREPGGSLNTGFRIKAGYKVKNDYGDGTFIEVTGDGVNTNFYDKTYTLLKVFIILITGAVGKIVELHVSNSRLTYIKLHKSMKNLEQFIAQGNMFTTEVVDDILITINKYGTSGPGRVINLLGSEPPSAAGLAAKAELEARGWMVLVAG